MSQDDELRGLLERAVPEAPSQIGRSVGAVERARVRRRRLGTVVTVVTVAAVVAAVAVPVAARTVLSGDVDTSLSRPGERLGVCPVGYEPGPIPFGLPLEPGVVAARVCGDLLSAGTPSNVLTTGVSEIVDLISALPESNESPVSDTICSSYFAARRPRPAILFEYPDGSVRGIGLPFCRGVTLDVAGTDRGSRADLLNILSRFTELVFAQEHPGEAFPDRTSKFSCADRPLARITSVPVLTRGVLCPTLNTPIRRHLRAIKLSKDDLEVLVADVRRRADVFQGLGGLCTHQAQPGFAVVGQDARGLVYRLALCGAYPTQPIGPFESRPGDLAQRVLDRLVPSE